MKYIFDGLEPQRVLRNFYDLSQVTSRQADNTQGISDYLVRFGKSLGLEAFQDETTNVIIYKPASPGYEKAPTVMLAAHMDMICAAELGVEHDFDRDPLELVLDDDGDTIHANGTTLGADCGLGMAFILAVLEAKDIPHPALEAVFTTNEETDMKGALQLHYDKLKSTVLLSTDAARLSLGGSGELEMELIQTRHMVPARQGDMTAALSIGGLIGGHSGENAFAERGNANTLLVRMLSDLQREKKVPFRVVSFTGGDTTACAFARNASCVLSFPAEQADTVRAAVREWHDRYKSELAVPDPDVELTMEVWPQPSEETCDDASTDQFLTLMTILPDGLCSLHKYFEHKCESCVNVGVVEMVPDTFRIVVCIRSALASKKYFQFDKIQRICALMGVELHVLHDLPQWEYNSASRAAQVVGPIYADMEADVAQGTCEQGIFLMHMPGIEAVGVGPVVESPHSPNEHFSLAVMADDYARFLKALAAMKDY